VRLPNWIRLFGVTGLLFLLVVGAVSAAAEVRTPGRSKPGGRVDRRVRWSKSHE
jgi:hypothetical protein